MPSTFAPSANTSQRSGPYYAYTSLQKRRSYNDKVREILDRGGDIGMSCDRGDDDEPAFGFRDQPQFELSPTRTGRSLWRYRISRVRVHYCYSHSPSQAAPDHRDVES